jgi:uncharacterized protein (TIGR03790 family)
MRLNLLLGIVVCVAASTVERVSLAGLAPESVLLVVNGDSPASLAVANEYVHLRNIPDSNVVTLTGVTNVEQLSVDEFRKQILVPVLTAIDQRGLKSQIRCVAYSADLPTAIHVNGDVGDRKLPQVLTPVASINGLTFLHQLTLAKDIRYLDLNVNSYARRVGVQSKDTPWQPDEIKQYAGAVQQLELESRARGTRRGPRDEQPADALRPVNSPALLAAMESLAKLRESHPQSPGLLYNLACALATRDRNDEALATLKAAVAAGWFDHQHAARDPDWKPLQDHADFKALLNEMKSVKLEVLPARGFRSDAAWQPNGEPNPNVEQPRFLLSTVLGITAGRGLTVAEVIDGLRRSAAADGTRPKGTVYFVRNGDVRSTTREWGFASAVDKLKLLGVDAAIEEGVLPQKKQQVAGAMIGIADFDWPKSDSTILPGAIVEHLTSFGGVMSKGAGQTPLTEFLRHGAAGASGTVTEPYAIQAKFPNPFIHVHYASGCSLAEAFYLSVTGPYQLLIVGDPLCNPWRRELNVTAEIPATDKPWRGIVTLAAKVESPDGIAPVEFSLYVDGRHLKSARPNEPIEWDTTKLPDGAHHLTVLASGNDAIESIGRWTTHCTVLNGDTDRQPKLTARSGPDHPIDKPLEIESTCPGAKEITIHHLGRVVIRITGDKGTALLDPKALGMGKVTLHPIASMADGKVARGRMLSVAIQPPPE